MPSFGLVLLTRRLSDLALSGLPLGRSLELLADQSERTSDQQLLQALHHAIEGGKSFSEALSLYPKTFSAVYIGLVQAGEASGSFDTVLHELAQWLENEIDLRQRLLASTIYPMFLIVLAMAVCLFLVGFVIPRFEPLFEELGQRLPWPTRILMGVTGIVTHYGWLILPLIVVLGAIAYTRRIYLQTFLVRLLMTFKRLSAPLRALYLERWAFGMCLLLRNGLSVPDALETSRSLFGHSLITFELERVVQKIREGYPLATSLEVSPLFPPVLREMVASGEETGELEHTFSRIATAYRKESELHRRLLAAVLEPALVMGMGGIVALAMFLPLLQMQGGFQ
jgi:type II secretory pathway component PulF